MNDYRNKNLLIIGAGLLQMPAIKIANELGLNTIVTDYNENAPGMKIADNPIVISTKDIDGTVRTIKKINKKIKIHGVITIGTDASMTVAAVANALGLPGIEFENAEAATNKLKMRERFKEHNIPIPDFYKCWSLKDLKNISKMLSYPFVIKPVDNMGARGVMKIENESMLELAFNKAKKASPSGELIVEEYMEGPELSIDALIYNGKIHIAGVADRIIEREPYFIEIGHVMPSALPEYQINNAIEIFKEGVDALGITIGAAKGDIKITKKGTKVGEIAARLSGGFMSAYTYPYSSGVNLIHNAIDIALGYPPYNLVPTKNAVAIERAIIPKPGVVKEISGYEDVLSIPGVVDLFIHIDIGDEIREPESNVEKAGNFIVVKDTREKAWETVNEALKTIKIKTERDKKITWNEIKHRARERFNRKCFVCKVCNGYECRGMIPGMGGIGSGKSFIRNYRDINRILIKTRTIHDVTTVDTQTDFLGIPLDLPLAAAPITGCDINLGGSISELEYDTTLISSSKQFGILGFVGDGAPSELYKAGIESLKLSSGYGGIIFKPRADQEEIIKRIKAANEVGAKFIGIDIDAISFPTMGIYEQKVEPKSLEQLKELVQYSEAPFILKGIMNVEDAEKAVEAGASGIIVSNHGGRITENHPSSISVLKEISDAVKDKIKIIFDGGVRTGEDIFKALALGADLIMVGRPFSTAVLGGGKEGVELVVEKFKEELRKIMLLTGTETLNTINEKIIICPDFTEPYFSKDDYKLNI